MTLAQLAALQPAERAEIARALDDDEAALALRSHRAFAESPHWCGRTLSPLMAAIMDAAEGRPVTTIDDAACVRHFGCTLDKLPRAARRLVAFRAGGRAGKTSRLIATKALHAALTVSLPTLAPGEKAVALLIAPDLVLAHQILGFVRGYAQDSPRLAAMVARDTADEIELIRPDGERVTIRVRAASGRGITGRGFVLVFFALDEAAFFRDASGGVVNDTEIHRAAVQRLAPDAQAWVGSTPWVQGVGLLEETLASDWGTHTHALCAQAPTRDLNPTWDADGSLERWMRETDPENAAREIDAVPLPSGTHQFLSREAVDAAFARGESLPQRGARRVGCTYTAGGDTGFRKNSSALSIVERAETEDGDRFRPALLEERKPQPGAPLVPKEVVGEFAGLMAGFGAEDLVTDAHEIDEVRAALAEHGMGAVLAPSPAEAFAALRLVLHEGRIDLPPNPRLRGQLRGVLVKPMPGGGTQVVLPRMPDGSHGDLAVALARAVWQAMLSETDDTIYRVKRRR